MSEPAPNLDLTALSDALGDNDREALARSAKDEEHNSPATLSPSSSPRQASPVAHTPPSRLGTSTIPASPAAVAREPEQLDANVRNIKAMFPDLDVDTIQAVLVADGGDFERAINTLLQMSDPTYVPPPPFQQSSQQDHDEQLARSLAAQEGSTQQTPSFFPSGRGGGGGSGLGSLFGVNQQSTASSAAPSSYDPNQLSYQPRVRRNPNAGNQQSAYEPSRAGQQQQQQQQHQQPYQARSSSAGMNESSSATGWPGPREAKVWQEDINKFAENGLAKAASTFSALRQRGERALQGVSQQSQTNSSAAEQTQPTNAASSWTTRRAASAVSPTIGSHRGFDKDPEPVGDNELAKVLARGREDGKKKSIADRYKKVSSPSYSRSESRDQDEEKGDVDDTFGWDDAGRTDVKSVAPSFEPIRISDNSTVSTGSSGGKVKQAAAVPLANSPRNAVSLMEGSTGRGLTSPQRASTDAHDDIEEDDASDDLEYVANPFEDDD
ncbi:hypothetical protein CBS101457_004818 [Exobasidium rhododendri]|nr:hypothetical protein CBS101457_004818 [Exobasidium rhododendri]